MTATLIFEATTSQPVTVPAEWEVVDSRPVLTEYDLFKWEDETATMQVSASERFECLVRSVPELQARRNEHQATLDHTFRVGVTAWEFVRWTGFGDYARPNVLIAAAWLHDIGKLFLPPSVVYSQRKFRQQSPRRILMDTHADIGASVLPSEGYWGFTSRVAYLHHAILRWPQSVVEVLPRKEWQMLLAISLSDTIVALTEPRLYRRTPLTLGSSRSIFEEVTAEVRKHDAMRYIVSMFDRWLDTHSARRKTFPREIEWCISGA